jgi:hypothetical protein
MKTQTTLFTLSRRNPLRAGFLIWLLLAASTALPATSRQVLSLDGKWQIADSLEPETIPARFDRTVPVPGLANLARPAFKDVDAFMSRELLANRIRSNLSPADWLTNYWKGKINQDRNYFWYRKTFRAPASRAVARLKINKAQFGTAVWLNGQKLGEYSGCFTAGFFDLSPAIRWNAENTLLVRVGAHPAVLPDNFPTGSDFEKIKWTPGIYDSVSVILCDNPLIDTVQVAPDVAAGRIVVQTRVRNSGATPVSSSLSHRVRAWKGGKEVASSAPIRIALEPGQERVFTEEIALPNARLWSPEDPFLHVVESRTDGDSVSTRFGMREFRFDAATQQARLNGKPYYLRGSNITLHRFFEDPLCGDLPWRDSWVRKLLGKIPKQMHWNYFRFCIGPAPERWFEICDEEGLLVQNEFFVWTGGPGWYKGYSRTHDAGEMVRQYQDWMRDHWNHPSVVVWDANNETTDKMFGEQIIPRVRPDDLSKRPWENSYNKPVMPEDPVEYHPYLMSGGYRGKLAFKMSDLEKMDGKPRPGALPSETNPRLINEYGWLWLNRDGTPTLLTDSVYAQVMGTNVTTRERLDRYAYLLAGKTEFWRAHRHFAGIIHFVYLTCSYPGVYTADHFADMPRLKLDPAFADFVGEAFKPLGVYVNFFQPALASGSEREFTIMMVNDHGRRVEGDLELRLETKSGKVLSRATEPFGLDPAGSWTTSMKLPIPGAVGDCVLKAIAKPRGGLESTVSRRWVTLTKEAAAGREP